MTCALVKPTSGYRTFSRLVSLRVRPSICTSTAVSLATFAHHLLRGLVDAKSLEGRRAELPAPRPFHELELGDDLRLDEVGGSRRRRAGLEWVLVGGDGLQLCVQVVERFVGEPGTDLSGVDELPLLVVVAHQERARISASLALAVEPAADDELLPEMVLDLLPRPGPAARLVTRVELLCHHALQVRLRAGLLHGRAAALLVRRRLP